MRPPVSACRAGWHSRATPGSPALGLGPRAFAGVCGCPGTGESRAWSASTRWCRRRHATAASATLSTFESDMDEYLSCKERVDDEEFVAWADIKFFKPVPDPGLGSQHRKKAGSCVPQRMRLEVSRGPATSEAPEKFG